MYTFVSEFEENNQGVTLGRKDTEFSFYSDYSYSKETPVISNSWRRGEKIVESFWKNRDYDFILMKRDSFFYKTDNRKSEMVEGFKLHQHITVESYCPNEGNADPIELYHVYEPARFEYTSAWRHLDSHKQVVFDANGQNPVSQITNYYYENHNHMQPTKVETINSIGEKIYEISKYPDDYADDYVNVSKLKENYIVGIPLQKESIKNGKTIGGSYFKYNDYGQPKEEYAFYDLKETASNGDIPANYKRKTSYSYDPTSLKLIQHTPENDSPTAYVWGYNYQFPVASVRGKDYSNIVSHLGGQSQIDLLQHLDDLDLLTALSPLANLDNTSTSLYTYDTFFGITSQTDPNGVTTYYEYDDFGRLEYVKDNDGNIINRNAYNYKSDQTDVSNPTPQPVSNYSITTSISGVGTITPTYSVAKGGNGSVSISTDVFHKINDVLIDGVSVGAVTSYAFSNITANHSVKAFFAIKLILPKPRPVLDL